MRNASFRSFPEATLIAVIALLALSGCGPHKPIVTEYDFSKMKKGDRAGFFGDCIQGAINREILEIADGKLVVHGRPRGEKYGCHEIQLESFGKTGLIRLTAAADHWAPDTSVGFELWADRGGASTYDGIVFKDGALRIVNSRIVGAGDIIEPVEDWGSLKKEFNTIELHWDKSEVTLKINDEVKAFYSGPAVPDEYLNFRVNADVEHDDRLLIKNIYLSRG